MSPFFTDIRIAKDGVKRKDYRLIGIKDGTKDSGFVFFLVISTFGWLPFSNPDFSFRISFLSMGEVFREIGDASAEKNPIGHKEDIDADDDFFQVMDEGG